MLFNLFNWILNNYIEFIAVISGIIGVYLTAKQIIWCWPVAIVSVVLSLYVFFVAKLYQDSILQLFYLGMSFYGWYNWLHGGTKKVELKVNWIRLNHALFLILIGFLSIIIFGYLFQNYTDAALPYWDATTTVWGIIGTYMMAKKMIDNWIVWIIIDLLNVGIYFYKELYGFTVLYFIFTLLAIYGLREWITDYRKIKIN
ncbi:nicotinamide riboside transporter PnuC [candidate division KSB1 bacterium]